MVEKPLELDGGTPTPVAACYPVTWVTHCLASGSLGWSYLGRGLSPLFIYPLVGSSGGQVGHSAQHTNATAMEYPLLLGVAWKPEVFCGFPRITWSIICKGRGEEVRSTPPYLGVGSKAFILGLDLRLPCINPLSSSSRSPNSRAYSSSSLSDALRTAIV